MGKHSRFEETTDSQDKAYTRVTGHTTDIFLEPNDLIDDEEISDMDVCGPERDIDDMEFTTLPAEYVDLVTKEPASRKGEKREHRLICDGISFSQLTQNYSSFVESKAAKEMWARNEHEHTWDFLALVISWGKKNKRHLFNDALLTVDIVAKELGYKNAVDYLKLRGFSVYASRRGPIAEYRKLRECLRRSKVKGEEGKMYKFHALILLLCQRIRKSKMERKFIVDNSKSICDRITRHTLVYHIAYTSVSNALWSIIDGFGIAGFDLCVLVNKMFADCIISDTW